MLLKIEKKLKLRELVEIFNAKILHKIAKMMLENNAKKCKN